MLRRTRVAAAVTGLVLLIAAPACGGDDGGDPTSAPSSAPSTATASENGSETTGDTVAIEDFAYKPETLKAKAGTAVTFTNKDAFAHTVTAKDKSYDSGNLDQGGTFEHTYDEPGTYEYFCTIHNSMTGSVVVE